MTHNAHLNMSDDIERFLELLADITLDEFLNKRYINNQGEKPKNIDRAEKKEAPKKEPQSR